MTKKTELLVTRHFRFHNCVVNLCKSLNYTGQPYESEESEISSEDDCSEDGENILNEYRKNKFTFLPEKKTKNLIVEKSIVPDHKKIIKKGMSIYICFL